MNLYTVTPRPDIAPYVHHFWVFESALGLPSGDARVVVPNGRHKLIVPYRNALQVQRTDPNSPRTQQHGPGDPVVIGLWEEPSILSSSAEHTCTIGVELLPHGLTRFLAVEAAELTQRVVSLSNLLGSVGAQLGECVANAPTIQQAVDIVQDFLAARIVERPPVSPIVDAALKLMQEANYRMEVSELERRLGYSRRYLHALFLRDVGLAPKRLASVLTFERLYRRFSQDKSVELLRTDALDFFYDQSHFIRNFRRFTGFSPTRFADMDNEFGRIFYVNQGKR